MTCYALPIALILLAGCPSSEEQVADVFTQARLFHDEGDLDKAIAGYTLTIKLDPTGVASYHVRGSLHQVMRDDPKAEADLARLL